MYGTNKKNKKNKRGIFVITEKPRVVFAKMYLM
jgi:hypothetical protein